MVHPDTRCGVGADDAHVWRDAVRQAKTHANETEHIGYDAG